MSDTREQRERRSWWGVAIASVVLVYALSAGPVIYGTVAFQKRFSGTSFIGIPVLVLYFPHLMVARHAEWYYRYLDWCAVSAGAPGQSYESYKRNFFW